MGELSIGHLLVVLVIVVLLFGAKRIPEIAGSMGKGIKEFKASIGGNDAPPPQAQVQTPREAAELSTPRPSTSTAMQQSEEIAREPKRLV
jgi:sec-independent protein translocase protein TatA